jgi:hydroxymethylglutaryl-CoA reductase
MLIVNVHVDVCEAMGANIINTVAEVRFFFRRSIRGLVFTSAFFFFVPRV